jgi:hypothetical protein
MESELERLENLSGFHVKCTAIFDSWRESLQLFRKCFVLEKTTQIPGGA